LIVVADPPAAPAPAAPAGRRRWRYAAAGTLVIAAGLTSRSDWLSLPPFFAKYGGDALWALLVFLGLAFVLARAPLRTVAILAIVFCWGIECSQLYQADWIFSLRRTLFGRLVLGSTFNPPDLLAYLAGIAVGIQAETRWLGPSANPRRPR
jgi:hypothetical protein